MFGLATMPWLTLRQSKITMLVVTLRYIKTNRRLYVMSTKKKWVMKRLSRLIPAFQPMTRGAISTIPSIETMEVSIISIVCLDSSGKLTG